MNIVYIYACKGLLTPTTASASHSSSGLLVQNSSEQNSWTQHSTTWYLSPFNPYGTGMQSRFRVLAALLDPQS